MGDRPSRCGCGGPPLEGPTRACFVRPRGALIASEGIATGPATELTTEGRERTHLPVLQYGCSKGPQGWLPMPSACRQNIAFCGSFFGGPAWTRTRDLFLIREAL